MLNQIAILDIKNNSVETWEKENCYIGFL